MNGKLFYMRTFISQAWASWKHKHVLKSVSAVDFVDMAYRHLLARGAGKGELEKTVAEMASGLSQRALVQRLVRSSEFTDRLKDELWGREPEAVSDEDYLEAVFYKVLKRGPDADGISNFLGHLSKGQSRQQVLSDIVSGREFASKLAMASPESPVFNDILEDILPEHFVELACLHLLGEAPTPHALVRYLEIMQSGQSQTSLIRYLIGTREFGNVLEATVKKISRDTPSDSDWIRAGYKHVLERQPDNPGLTSYTIQLHDGKPREAVYFHLTRSEEFQNLIKEKSVAAGFNYNHWVSLHGVITQQERGEIEAHIQSLPHQTLFSIVCVVNGQAAETVQRSIESLCAQLYENWELFIINDDKNQPPQGQYLGQSGGLDRRVRVGAGDFSGAINKVVAESSGEFAALLAPGDKLPEHALYMVAETLNRLPDCDLIYSDEDAYNDDGLRSNPFFKPDWSPDLFYSSDYILRLLAIRRELLAAVMGTGDFPVCGYDLALRLIEKADHGKIRHIPHVLYHRLSRPGDSGGHTATAEHHKMARIALKSHMERMGIGTEVAPAPGTEGCHRIIYALPDKPPLVSVIIATKDKAGLLRACVAGLLSWTNYPDIEIIIVDNNSVEPATQEFLAEISKERQVKVLKYDQEFNFAAINNIAVREANGGMICLLNNDIIPIAAGWLREMVAHGLRPEIGVVGAKLYYPDDSIQHAGIGLGIREGAEHLHRRLSKGEAGYQCRANVIQNFSAVTGACMVMRRNVFEELSGFDEALPLLYNDVDFCLRVIEKGYRILWTPYAELYHFESATQGGLDTKITFERLGTDRMRVAERWGKRFKEDPYYNPNLTIDNDDYSLALNPRVDKPWIFLERAEEPDAGQEHPGEAQLK